MPGGLTSALAAAHPLDELHAADQNPHYVRSVTEVGEHNEVIAHEDIYAANGIKLIAKGARIDRGKLERLTQHKLRVPLDLSLVAERTVTTAELLAAMDHERKRHPALDVAVLRSGDQQASKAALGSIELPAALAFRLTIMRDDRASLFEHSLRVALLSCSVAAQMKLPLAQVSDALLAGLCHDLGEMHTDPRKLMPDRILGSDDLRYVYVHPITSFAVLEQIAGVHHGVMQAVLQHHERADGSGYPHGRSGGALALPGQIVAIADTTDALLHRFSVGRARVVLRLNRARYGARPFNAMQELLPAGEAAIDTEGSLGLDDGMARLFNFLGRWNPLAAALHANARLAPLEFIDDRIHSLQSLIYQAGLAPDLLKTFDFAADPEVRGELTSAVRELNRTLDDAYRELGRRCPAGLEQDPAVAELLRAFPA